MPPTTRRSTSSHVRRPTARQPIPKDVLVELSSKHNKECMFCGRKEISEALYGQLYQLNDVIVHYFCILLSSRAVQNGTDREGIWGFLLKDIKAELLRGSREPCFYCNKPGATISCCGLRCRKKFHLPCGLQHGSMHQYFQSFKSFCHQHRITQTVDLSELQDSTPVQCAICKEDTVPTPLPTSIWAPCCKRNAWFHRKCIQELALSAGYFFKCPLCNNVDTFKSRMLTLGIYIPSRDASWETVPNAYAELLERHSTCNADTCLCPHSDRRNFQQESGSWEIILCHTCGSNGTHMLCSSLKCDQKWFCSACRQIAGPITSKRRRLEISNVPTMLDEDRSSNILSQRRITARDLSQTEIRGSTRLNNNNNNNQEVRIPNNLSTPQRIVDSIVISDDDSDDDIQVISIINPQPLNAPARSGTTVPLNAPARSGTTVPLNAPARSGTVPLNAPARSGTAPLNTPARSGTVPIITNVKSLCTNNNVSEFPTRNAASSRHTRNNDNYNICESIDLTNSDDENDT